MFLQKDCKTIQTICKNDSNINDFYRSFKQSESASPVDNPSTAWMAVAKKDAIWNNQQVG